MAMTVSPESMMRAKLNFDTDCLRSFVAVADTMSISRAERADRNRPRAVRESARNTFADASD
jgi:hypothetical protein